MPAVMQGGPSLEPGRAELNLSAGVRPGRKRQLDDRLLAIAVAEAEKIKLLES